MLKKIMKAALAASLVFGMSSFAYAADGKIGGSFKEYFGQYNSGAKKYSSHFDSIGEANLQFKGTAGKMSVFFELESNQEPELTKADFNNTQAKLSYASPFALISIGNVTNIGMIPMSSSGFKTSNIPNSTRRALLVNGYSEGEGVDFVIPLEGMGMVQFTMYENGVMGYGGGTVNSLNSSGASFSKEGTAMALGADLKFSGIGVRLGYHSAKTDDPASSTDKAFSTNGMMLGVSVPVGDTIAIKADYSSATYSTNEKVYLAKDKTYTSLDFSVEMSGVGPGKLVVALDTQTDKLGTTKNELTVPSLVYDIGTGEGAGIQLGYIAPATKATSGTPAVSTTTTKSFMGVGFYAAF